MDKDDIRRVLTRLAEVLSNKGIQGELYVVGGAAMALAYDARRSTRDIDAVFVPKKEIYAAAREIAGEFHLPENWLNDAVKGYVTDEDEHAVGVLDLPALRVMVASPRYMLAMKLLASRREDEHDIRFLLELLAIRRSDEALQILLKLYPESRILPRTRFMLEEILDE